VEEVCGGQVGPFEDLEVIRVEAGVSTARFCHLFDMPERTWRRWQARARAGGQPKGAMVTAGPTLGDRGDAQARPGAPGVGSSQDLGDGPPRRPPCVRGDRAAAAAQRGLAPGILEGFAPTAQNPHTSALVEVNNGV
jgi:hypothetical protein